MIDYQTARKIAEAEIASFECSAEIGAIVIYDESSTETPHAWMFCYNSQRYLETDDDEYFLGGNAPIFVSKSDGAISTFSTTYSLEKMIEMYERAFDQWRLDLIGDDWKVARKMSALKKILGWSQEKLAAFKEGSLGAINFGTYAEMASLQLRLQAHGLDVLLVEEE